MRRVLPRSLSRRLGVVAVLLPIVLVGCGHEPMERVETAGEDQASQSSPEPNEPKSAPSGSTPAPQDPALEEYYDQDLDWQACGNYDCAKLTVPVSYDAPADESIELALKRLPSRSDGAPSLVINPGGPGGSGADMVESVERMFSPELLAAYDVVGFDPRGVAGSAPVDCVSDAQLDRLRAADYDVETPEGLEAYREDAELIAQGCASRTGELLGHVDTASAARDMDILRAALGEDALDYLGYSYGTHLGAVYADIFPQRVGRFVLDGAMDPSLSAHQMTLDQAVGFEEALRAYVEDCQAGPDCPLRGDADDGMEQIRTLLDLTADNPLPTADGRELTAPLAVSGILTPLYDTRSWPALTSALTQAMESGDGSQLLFLADTMAGRAPDGTYRNNSTEANWAVNCLDQPATGDISDWRRQADELADAAPTFGPALSYGDVLCDAWPVEGQQRPGPLDAEGAPPIVVVGTTGDPATPYEWSVSLAEQLASGVLVTHEGEGHTAYGRSNDCVLDAVDAFLVEGDPPKDGLTC
ncbi:alpha/beta hydrolase [Georgenia halophila]|uniref:Alpha/beta hydrolase n=1 Tax=Georgenia halophila TaxID=620889 RepID=A0ABP8L0A5_9MICO